MIRLLKFAKWFMTLTRDQRIAYKVTNYIMGFLDILVTESLTSMALTSESLTTKLRVDLRVIK